MKYEDGLSKALKSIDDGFKKEEKKAAREQQQAAKKKQWNDTRNKNRNAKRKKAAEDAAAAAAEEVSHSFVAVIPFNSLTYSFICSFYSRSTVSYWMQHALLTTLPVLQSHVESRSVGNNLSRFSGRRKSTTGHLSGRHNKLLGLSGKHNKLSLWPRLLILVVGRSRTRT